MKENNRFCHNKIIIKTKVNTERELIIRRKYTRIDKKRRDRNRHIDLILQIVVVFYCFIFYITFTNFYCFI